MAEHKDYGLTGVNHNLQLGKQGPQLKHNGDGTVSVTDISGNSLTTVTGANATQSNHFVTKAQLDNVQKSEATLAGNITYNGSTVTLGTIPAGSKTVITTVNISQVWDDANSTISVGTDSDQALLASQSYIQQSELGAYQIITTQLFVADTTIKGFVPSSNATQGAGSIVVSYY